MSFVLEATGLAEGRGGTTEATGGFAEGRGGTTEATGRFAEGRGATTEATGGFAEGRGGHTESCWHSSARVELGIALGVVALASEGTETTFNIGCLDITTDLDVTFIVSYEFDGVLNLDFLGLDLELTLALELSADLSLAFKLEVTGVLNFSLDLGLSASLEFEVVFVLTSELSLFLANFDVSLDLELTSAEALVDGSLAVLTVDSLSLNTVAFSLG